MEKLKEFYRLITYKPIIIKGDFETKMVWIDEKELTPEYSKEIYNHSQEGFDWGNSGPGASQLALAILLEVTKNVKISMILHHLFKNEYILPLRQSDFEITINIGDWFYKNLSRNGLLFE